MAPANLECRECGRTYAAGAEEPWRCRCGHPLDFAHQPTPSGDPPPFERLNTRTGLWTFSGFLAMPRLVTLGEGMTPLVEAPAWDAQFKLEYVSPTGSFKDRGATTTLSRAEQLGVDTVIEDSSGNAGAAIATYAARAGIDADIYVPADVTQSKLVAIQRAGARPVRVEGTREDVTEAAIDAVEAGDGWYASHAWNPAFYAGTMTFALEVAAQRNWSVPDAVVLPVGHGTLLLGAYRGFRVLEEMGVVETTPRLLVGQAAGYAPIADQFRVSDDDRPDNDLADGIQVREPARRGAIVEAIASTDGDAIALGADPVELQLDRLHRAGFYVEPTCAVALAALQAYRNEGVLGEDADVVVPLTGSGLKTP